MDSFYIFIFGQDLQDELDVITVSAKRIGYYRFPPETRNKNYPKNPVNPVYIKYIN